MQEMINSTERSSSFWYYTALILKQFDGMKTGYALAATQAQVTFIGYSISKKALH